MQVPLLSKAQVITRHFLSNRFYLPAAVEQSAEGKVAHRRVNADS